MDHADLLALFDREQRFDVTYNDSTREALPHVVRHLPRFEGGGFIVYSKSTAENADAVIAQQIDFFDSHGWDFEWKAYGHDAPADLGTRLEAQGFILEDREAVMVLDLDGEVGVQETPTTTQEIRRITVPDEIVDVVAVEEVVWQEDYRTLGDRLRRDSCGNTGRNQYLCRVSWWYTSLNGMDLLSPWHPFCQPVGGINLGALPRPGVLRSIAFGSRSGSAHPRRAFSDSRRRRHEQANPAATRFCAPQ